MRASVADIRAVLGTSDIGPLTPASQDFDVVMGIHLDTAWGYIVSRVVDGGLDIDALTTDASNYLRGAHIALSLHEAEVGLGGNRLTDERSRFELASNRFRDELARVAAGAPLADMPARVDGFRAVRITYETPAPSDLEAAFRGV